jgi:hypothetical protein
MKNPLKMWLSLKALKGLPTFDKLVLFAVLLLSVLGPFGLGAFLIGMLYPWGLFIPICFVIPLLAFLLFCTLMASLFSWRKRLQSKLSKWLLPLGLVLLIGIDYFMGSKFPVAVPFTFGFKRYVAMRADLPEIRTWLDKQKERCSEVSLVDLTKHGEFAWPADINWPDSLLKFDPHYIYFLTDDKGYPMVDIIYGGGMSHWGFVVGEPNLVVPQKKHEKAFVVSPLTEGCYVWYGK